MGAICSPIAMFASLRRKWNRSAEVVGKTDADMPWGDVFRGEDEQVLAGRVSRCFYQQLHCNRVAMQYLLGRDPQGAAL